MKKKILMILLVISTFLEVLIPNLNVSAAPLDDELYIDYNYEWWVATKGFSGKKFTAQPERMIRRRSDGKPVYCIQPQIKFNDNSSVHGITDLGQMLQMSGLSAEDIEKITLISYYGYGYGNHTTAEWFYATQMLIWQVTKPGWTYAIADNDETVTPSNRYDTYYNEINSLVSKHAYQPSFHNQKVTMKVGETFTLTDTNNVLDKYYNGVENEHFKAEISGNQLKITAKTAFDGRIELGQKANQNPPMIYSGANQLVFPTSDPDSKFAYVQLESQIRVDFQKYFGSNTDGVYQPERNATFEIYNNENNQLLSTVTTDSDGKFNYYFSIGTYRIHQIKGQKGHKFIKDIILVVDENSTKEAYILKNEAIATGTLEFTKEDFSTGEPLPDTKVEVHKKDDDSLVFEGKTDENGKIVIPELEMGEYYIVEKEAPEGYTLNPEKMYFEIKEDGEVVKATMKDEKIKSTLKLHKTDENNNPLEGVEFGLYDKDGNLLGTYKTDKNGDIEIEVEYGSYYLQEIATIEGHELNPEKIYFDVTKDGEVIEKSIVNKTIEQPKEETKVVKVPDTLSNSYLPVIAVPMLLLGLMLIFGTNKKNKKVRK